MELKEITIKGKRLSYRCQGEGAVVVLLHGFGEDSSIWKNQFEAFPALKLIIPDLPGTGRSDMIDDMSMEGLAESIKALIEHETASLFFKEGEPHSVIMIGHSMGGYITLAFAEKYHHMLRGFGLFHSTAFADSEEKKQIRQKGIGFIQSHGAIEFLKTSIPNLYSPVTKEKNPQLIEEQINVSRNFSPSSLVSYYVSMINRPDRTEVLKQTHLPVLFVLGKYDTAVPLKDGLEQSYLPELSYIHILNESGHMGMIEEGVEADRILKNYIASVTKTTQPE
ncbi:MAG TPA: alpha/beta hydrolase [Flavisolibacter sp.]|nr:alpha/beta hydrolase [Flavisolibacter sp.]